MDAPATADVERVVESFIVLPMQALWGGIAAVFLPLALIAVVSASLVVGIERRGLPQRGTWLDLIAIAAGYLVALFVPMLEWRTVTGLPTLAEVPDGALLALGAVSGLSVMVLAGRAGRRAESGPNAWLERALLWLTVALAVWLTNGAQRMTSFCMPPLVFAFGMSVTALVIGALFRRLGSAVARWPAAAGALHVLVGIAFVASVYLGAEFSASQAPQQHPRFGRCGPFSWYNAVISYRPSQSSGRPAATEAP